MEYKKSEPIQGTLDDRYVIFYHYEFPRATKEKGKFLPKGTVRIREYLFCDGGHGQIVQMVVIPAEELAKGNEQRALVDTLLALSKEDKKFKEGTLTREDLCGEVREYTGRKLINIGDTLATQEKIGLFASARRVKDSKARKKRARRWKMRVKIFFYTTALIAGIVGGALLQKQGFFDFSDNAVYQNYFVPAFDLIKNLLR